ncbi:hypothetical protein, partial [Dorea sp. AGR2135]|uniref:hypothetical protein n=1 Tax=Dorea sp. AGR2135 TaxID=1280669 RepID=UPI001A981131
NSRRIKNGHISFGGINSLTDWFRKIHKMLEHSNNDRYRKYTIIISVCTVCCNYISLCDTCFC